MLSYIESVLREKLLLYRKIVILYQHSFSMFYVTIFLYRKTILSPKNIEDNLKIYIEQCQKIFSMVKFNNSYDFLWFS